MSRLISVFFACYLIIAGCTQRPDKNLSTEKPAEINEYPAIVLRLTDGRDMFARDLKGNNVFVMFQPDCDHCQEEAVHIEQRLNEFKDYTLYFISSAPMEHIVAFARNFKLDSKENVKFAWTATEGVLTYFGPIQTPSIYVYANKKLKAQFNGQTNIDDILNTL